MNNAEDIKNNAKKVWSGFAPLENLTGTAAPRLIKFANINKNQTTVVLKLIPLFLRYFMMNLKHLESFPINSGGYTPLWLNKPSVRRLTAEVQVYPVVLAIDDVLVFIDPKNITFS